MNLDVLETGLARMEISDQPQQYIMQTPMIQEIFNNNMDIYGSSVSRQERFIILEVPNIRCSGRYYDDEDFIYARMKFADGVEVDNLVNLDYITYQMQHGINIHSSGGEVDINPSKIMAMVLYLFQHTSAYYTSLRHLQPLERVKYLPVDLLNCVRDITSALRWLLDMDMFQYQPNEDIPADMFEELKYGIGLIACHARVICNHYKAMGLNLGDGEIEEKHLKKLMRLVNNICVIMIYFKMVF